MQYNLLDSHKELAQWLVKQYRDGYLGDSFTAMLDNFGNLYIIGKGSKGAVNDDAVVMPKTSMNAFKTLAEDRLILFERRTPESCSCGLLAQLFTAVDTNFGELETDLKPRSDGVGGLGLSLPKFSQLLARDFSQSELNDLLFNMGIESAEIFGNSLSENTRETVKYAQRHGRLLELLIRSAKLRPRTDWSQLYE